jgi:hypothetical protein
MLQAVMLRGLDGQADIKRELADVRGLVLALNDKVQRLDRDLGEKVTRLDRSVHEIKDDIWITLKAELMGRQGNYETRIDERLDEFAERIAALEAPSEPKP